MKSSPMWRFFERFLISHWKMGILLFLTMVVTTILTFPVPLLIRYIIDEIIPKAYLSELAWVGLGLVILVAFRGLFSYLEQYLSVVVDETILADVQKALFNHVQSLPYAFFHEYQVGYLMSRIRNDPSAAKDFFLNSINILKNSLVLLLGVALLFYLDWRLTLIAVAILPTLALASKKLNSKMQELCQDIQEGDALVSQELQEGLSAIQTVKIFSLENWMNRRIGMVIDQLKQASVKTNALGAFTGGLLTFITGVGPVLLLWTGAYQVIAGNLSLGTVVAFMSLIAYLYTPTQAIISINLNMQRAKVAATRIFELLDKLPESIVMAFALEEEEPRGLVEFEQVDFVYPNGTSALKRVSLRIEPGRKVAVVGRTGSGKSTLLSLLIRLYEPTEGVIRIDGRNIRDIPLTFLRRQASLVTQDVFLFSGTVMDNLRCGNPRASDEEVIQIATAIKAHEFIQDLPQGYHTIVGERGVKLSGGQKQLIALTRALLRKPQILLLDEATSAMDSETEAVIWEALHELMRTRTVIIVAHRLSAIRFADLVFVMKEGRVVEQGCHDELLAYPEGEYRSIFEEQLIHETTKATETGRLR